MACKNGVLNCAYPHHSISYVLTTSNNRELLGLDEAFKKWQGMLLITKQEAASNISVSGGQGNGNIKWQVQGRMWN